jgi:hypothetical protein
MKKMSILVPVAAYSILLSAMVFASTPTSDTQGAPAQAPNRAEVFAAATCGVTAVSVMADAQSWQDALGNKRLQERALVRANASTDLANPCE